MEPDYSALVVSHLYMRATMISEAYGAGEPMPVPRGTISVCSSLEAALRMSRLSTGVLMRRFPAATFENAGIGLVGLVNKAPEVVIVTDERLVFGQKGYYSTALAFDISKK